MNEVMATAWAFPKQLAYELFLFSDMLWKVEALQSIRSYLNK